jgi:DNA-binding NarL/FixJ family response regulator/tetratricopeptide (TPR) repeat protein
MAVAGRLVGRAAELASLEHVLAELDLGHSAALEIVGEPGIGKTRLLAELSAGADARGHVVLSGTASELERDLPFWVFVDALDEYLQGLEPHRLEFLDGEIRTELAYVFPSLSARLGSRRGGALQHERYRTHRAVRELLELLAATKPLVLVLDDLHWADSGSVELLGALLHRPPAGAVLMALAIRPRRMPERLSMALERAHRAETLVRIELAALTRAEAREYLGEGFGSAEADALYEESGGNPFYLEQLARSAYRTAQAAPTVADISLTDIEVPPSVAAALAEELALLSDSAQRVLEGAAVAGDPFEPELAAAAAATPEVSAMAALDELLGLDLVRHTDVPRRFRFRHPLVRRAVYESTPGGWRLGAHERSATALAARGAPVAARAHHVERSARQGDAAAVAVLREAGEAAAHRAPASAARWFAAALALVSERTPTEERVELLLARAESLAAVGQFSDSHSALIESIELVPDESVALRVRLTTACAGLEHLLGRHEQAHARLASALENLADPASPEAVSLLIELATDGFYRMEYEPMRECAARALSAARPLGNRSLTAAALAVLAYAHALTDAITEAESHRLEAAALVDALPDDELALRLDAAVNLAAAEIDLERLAEAGAHAERAMALARATGQSDVVPVLVLALGWVRRLRGQLAEASELFDGAVEGARLSGNVLSLSGNLFSRSLTALAAGDVEMALTTAEESVELTSQLDHSLMSASSGLALAAALLEIGDPGRAVDVLVGPSGGRELPLIPGAWRANWLELLTRCWLALGRLDEATRSAAHAEACATARGLPLATGMADRAAAAVALEAGDPDLAARRALASAAAADDVGVPIEAALSRMLAGRALAQASQPESAAAELQHAAAQFDAHGAFGYRNQAEQELRRLGHRIHRRTRPGSGHGKGLDSLTEREVQVARLVVERKTNREIAAALFLSRKTVETHMRNMFRKLGVASRVELARAVEHADRTDARTSQ